jgi:3-oxoacyl-[acyl-carrier-protein] synthase-1
MNDKLYISGMGMITALGPSVATTAAAVRAGRNAYQESRYSIKSGASIKMAEVPTAVFESTGVELDEGDSFNEQYDHVIKMSMIAIQEACTNKPIRQPIPMVLAMPELAISHSIKHTLLTRNLANIYPDWINSSLTRVCHSGRAAAIEAIEFAFQYLHQKFNWILLGGSDSHCNYARLTPLEKADRLLTAGSNNGFAPGEGACFLLLTPHAELAEVRNGHSIMIHPPGISSEYGHMFSDEPYRGHGLDQAFKGALQNHPEQSITSIYSSMNGEHYWAKEYGVAYLRNKKSFCEKTTLEHPADAYGDIGSATSAALIALAAEHLHFEKNAKRHLVYGSADGEARAAVVLEKVVAFNVDNH